MTTGVVRKAKMATVVMEADGADRLVLVVRYERLAGQIRGVLVLGKCFIYSAFIQVQNKIDASWFIKQTTIILGPRPSW